MSRGRGVTYCPAILPFACYAVLQGTFVFIYLLCMPTKIICLLLQSDYRYRENRWDYTKKRKQKTKLWWETKSFLIYCYDMSFIFINSYLVTTPTPYLQERHLWSSKQRSTEIPLCDLCNRSNRSNDLKVSRKLTPTLSVFKMYY